MSRYCLTIAAIAAVPLPVYAQPVPDEAPLIVVTANGAASNIDRVGQSITLLDTRAIALRQLPAVADLLATTPGISLTRNGGAGQTTAIRIRGAEDAQTLVLIDGVRVNDPGAPAGAFDFATLLTANIAQIEILRGPNSVPWGSQAIGGVVNIVTSAPTETFSATLRGEVGSHDRRQLIGRISGRSGIVSASFGAGWLRDDGISAYVDGRECDGTRQAGGDARIDVALSDTLALDLRARYADSRTDADGYPPPFYSFSDTPDISKTREYSGIAGLTANLFENRLKNRISYSQSRINRDNFPTPDAEIASFSARGRVTRFEYRGDADLTRQLRFVFGAEHERSRFSDTLSRYAASVTGGYVQAIVTPLTPLTLTAGLRLDDHQNYGRKTTRSANAAMRLGSGTIVRASYGEGFKAPTLYQLFSDYGNSALVPETSRSYEAGVEQALIDRRLRFGVTFFRRRTTNQIDFFSCYGINAAINLKCIGHAFDGYYDNIAKSRARGIETWLELHPSEALSVTANYTWVDSRNAVTNLALLRRPHHVINAAIDWEARPWLRLGADVRSVSDSFDSDFRTFSRASLDGYTLVGLRASAPLGNGFELYGRVENLFDTRYTMVSGYGTPGRNAHLGVRASF